MVSLRFIRSANSDILQKIIALYRAHGWWGPKDTPALARRIIANSHCFLIALENDNLLGMGRAISDKASDAYIQDVAVAPGARGRGIGTKIIKGLKARLKHDGIKWVGLVAQNNSRGFYSRIGFKVITRSHPMMLKGNNV